MTQTADQPEEDSFSEPMHLDEELGEEEEVVTPVQFAQLEMPAAKKGKPRPSRLNNVGVDITVELGRKEMSVRDLVALKRQEIIELNKLAGEPFDIRVNDRPFAEGEVVVVPGDLMAVRITKMLDISRTPEEMDEDLL